MTRADIEYLESGMGAAPELIPGTFTPVVNRDNNYLKDIAARKRGHATGIPGINNQDRALVEAMGSIADRSHEHLGSSDVAVIAARRKLLRLAKDLAGGKEPDLPLHPAAFNVRPIDVTTADNDLDEVVSKFSNQLWRG